MDKTKKTYLIDEWTRRFVVLYQDIVKQDALPTKTAFAKGCGVSINTFNKIERGIRNFPAPHRPLAKKHLMQYYGLNKDYLEGGSTMFDWPPPKRRFPADEKIVNNFKDLRTKESLLKELQKAFAEIERLQQENLVLNEEVIAYKRMQTSGTESGKTEIKEN